MLYPLSYERQRRNSLRHLRPRRRRADRPLAQHRRVFEAARRYGSPPRLLRLASSLGITRKVRHVLAAASGLNTIGQHAILGAGTPPARDSS
jgi:hypothetical protein